MSWELLKISLFQFTVHSEQSDLLKISQFVNKRTYNVNSVPTEPLSPKLPTGRNGTLKHAFPAMAVSDMVEDQTNISGKI